MSLPLDGAAPSATPPSVNGEPAEMSGSDGRESSSPEHSVGPPSPPAAGRHTSPSSGTTEPTSAHGVCSLEQRLGTPPKKDPIRERIYITRELCEWLMEYFPSIHPSHKKLPKWFKHSCYVTLSDCSRLLQYDGTPEMFKVVLRLSIVELDKER